MIISEVILWFDAHPDKILDNVKINPWTTVTDGKKFVDSHYTALVNPSTRTFKRGYFDRLYDYWLVCAGHKARPYQQVKLLRDYRKHG